MREVDKYSRGIVKDRNRLYWEDFKRISSPCPPCEEQEVIADWIELLNERVAHTSSLASTEIALIREFRSQLIADVVTGKLDVRKVAGRLPEEPEAADVGELNDPLGGPSERRVMGPDELAAPKPAGS